MAYFWLDWNVWCLWPNTLSNKKSMHRKNIVLGPNSTLLPTSNLKKRETFCSYILNREGNHVCSSFKRMTRKNKIKDWVFFFPDCDVTHTHSHSSRAFALKFPSLAGGISFPPQNKNFPFLFLLGHNSDFLVFFIHSRTTMIHSSLPTQSFEEKGLFRSF